MVVVNLVLALLLVAGMWIAISSALDASLRKAAGRDRAHRRTVITGRSGGTFPRSTGPVNANPSPAIDVGLASRAGEQRA